ncbi:uncharacterized protein LOC116169848 [Photinus pyralis]|uniref:Protein TsetseEP domain-containing protein n=1 Tax=Photinus pyralis TaxID=7054 RepID=A0A1Y1MRG7_PHOPY|nr:uncharacterized protein LOC116169848 [Photinus pyralis]
MIPRFLVILLIIVCTSHFLHGTSLYKKVSKCEKLSRQVTNRLKTALKDYKYSVNSFDCNLQYIFDGVYSEFQSNLFDLNEKMAKTRAGTCKEGYESELEKLGDSPFDYCYNSTLVSKGYETIDNFERSAQDACKGCNVAKEDECLATLTQLSDEVETFSSSSRSILKALEKGVEACVARRAEDVSQRLKNLSESIAKCL